MVWFLIRIRAQQLSEDAKSSAVQDLKLMIIHLLF
jgi:hypothetical protein